MPGSIQGLPAATCAQPWSRTVRHVETLAGTAPSFFPEHLLAGLSQTLKEMVIERERASEHPYESPVEAGYHRAAECMRGASDVTAADPPQTPEDWWSTAIIDMQPGVIRYRGYAVEDLIGRVGFADMIFLLTRGELPDPEAARLLEAAFVAAVDHG